MTTVAVTGASGYLGRILLEKLGSHPAVGRVIGIDIAEPAITTRNLEFYRMDIRSPDLPRVLQGSSVLVHLAFAVDGGDAETRDTNVGGTRLVIEAAVHSGVRKVVFASSTMAYGAHPDNDFPLTELSPLRPARDLPHSGHNAEAEEIVRALDATHPGLETIVLRLSPVFGPTLSGTAARLVESPYAFRVRGYDVPGQALHETDAARALLVAAMTDLVGTYNVCPDDWLPSQEVADLLGQRSVELDPDRAEQVAERLSRLRVGSVPASFMPFLMYPWVASNGKLSATGFTFEHSAMDALRAGAEARKGWVSVGDVHFRPRRIALVGGAVAALLLGGAVRRRAKRS
jgi:nucleoside-diphosphate-sugar epimerase